MKPVLCSMGFASGYKMGPSWSLGPARKSSLFGHIINPLLTKVILFFGQYGYLPRLDP